MNQTVSGRIKFSFFEKELDNIKTIKDTEGAYYTDKEIPKDPILTGFIWKPELRPTSKADIIKGNTKSKAKPETKPTAKTPIKGTATKKPVVTPKGVNTLKSAIKDTTIQEKVIAKPIKLDSLKADSTKIKVIKN